MAFNSNGQVSYLVLDSLSHGSKYGLEIIEYISSKTEGNYIMKKPTLYSCLTRMEKKGLVSSSYWGESELGGKRHYYTITNNGKKTLEELKKEFENLSPNIISSFNATQSGNITQNEAEVTNFTMTDSLQTETSEKKPIFLQQDNIFNLVKEEKPQQKEAAHKETTNEEKKEVIENQIDIFSFQNTLSNETAKLSQAEEATQTLNTTDKFEEPTVKMTEPNTEDSAKIEYYESILQQTPVKDDAKFLSEHERFSAEQQNRRLYDTSSELKKYRKRKSFSENQIEMSVVYERAEDQEIQKERIEQLKASMINARQNRAEHAHDEIESKKEEIIYTKDKDEEVVEVFDDAIFITEPRINENEIPIQRKITPPNIDVTDNNLPAPKRNSNLEPTYKDMMAKLFERKNEKLQIEENTDSAHEILSYTDIRSFVDYGTLKKYYNGHGIEFKEYQKFNVERHHNTNFLVFISSTILLLLAGIGCAALFGILSATNHLMASSNFLFYTVPILFFVYMIFAFIKHKVYPSKKANLIYNWLINWAVFLLASVIVVVINILVGMQFETITNFLTSLLVPILGLFLMFPVNYHLKKFLFKKYAK